MSLAARSMMTTSDGRTLTYVDYGDPSGRVVLHHHGGLLSATDAAPLDDVAARLGIRLVAFDRPGISGSTSVPGRVTRDGANDAAALLDRLDVAEAWALGWSMGGQYALATAAVLGPRIRRVAVVAGCLPLDDPANRAELNDMDRRFTSLAVDHQFTLEKAALLWGGLARFSPQTWARIASQGEAEADAAAVRAHAQELADAAHDMSTQRHGIVEEYTAWARPWGFSLADVATPVDVWQGSDDHLVPVAWAERLADGLPDARLRILEGESHFLLLTHGDRVLAELVGE